MKIESKKTGRYLVVKLLEERMGADRAISFKEAMQKLVEQGNSAFVLDLSEVKFIDSTGLGAILSVLKRAGKGGEILITGTTETVGSMFKLTCMDRVFPMYPTVDEALSARV
jgi:anti-sigma B factor antagonist